VCGFHVGSDEGHCLGVGVRGVGGEREDRGTEPPSRQDLDIAL
jgi:hypothetical protein